MAERKYFGTDGIRGRVGEGPITPEFALRLGRAIAHVLTDGAQRSVYIGKDTRISGYMLESALEAGLSAGGAKVKLLGPMPTPAVAHLTRSMRGAAGIVISASHNLYVDNGFKFFSGRGEKLPDDTELAIEAAIDEELETVPAERLGKAVRVDDAVGRYIEFCKSTVPYDFRLDGLKVVVDCAHGATYKIAPRVFRELGAWVWTIGTEPDGFNINDGCGSTQLGALSRAVVEHGADLGIAFDGDGDRMLMVDHKGRTVDGDQLLYIIARDRKSRGVNRGGVVGTLMSNFGLQLALADMGMDFVRAQVGDRYVLEQLRDRDWLLGGETSGHILTLDRSATGDGVVSALTVLEALQNLGQSLAEAVAGMQKFPQVMINVPVNGGFDPEQPAIARACDRVRDRLGDEGRLILRPSGTEPVVRVTVEGRDENEVRTLAEELASVVEENSQ